MDFFHSVENLLKSIFEETYLLFIKRLWENIPSFVAPISGYSLLNRPIFMVVAMGGWLFALFLRHTYKIKIEALKTSLQSRKALLLKSPLQQEQDYKSDKTCLKAYKRFLANVMARQKEQALYIYTSLDVVYESFKNPAIKVSAKEGEEIIHSCLMILKSLSKGFIAKMENKPIILKNILEKVSAIFAEKSSHSNIEVELICLEDLTFHGDALFTELILMILIGKAIYRTPKNEKVMVIAKEQEGALHLEIRDKGYALPNEEKFLKHVFTPFIGDEALQGICQEHGFFFDSVNSDDKGNIATLVIPIAFPTLSFANVMPLFKKPTLLEGINH